MFVKRDFSYLLLKLGKLYIKTNGWKIGLFGIDLNLGKCPRWKSIGLTRPIDKMGPNERQQNETNYMSMRTYRQAQSFRTNFKLRQRPVTELFSFEFTVKMGNSIRSKIQGTTGNGGWDMDQGGLGKLLGLSMHWEKLHCWPTERRKPLKID